MIRFYNLGGYQAVLDMPLRTFWLMSNNINRISAEEDIRKLSIAAGSSSDKGFKATQEGLQREMGDVITRSERTIAKQGIQKLKDLNTRMKSPTK
jgi:hypothetical protein